MSDATATATASATASNNEAATANDKGKAPVLGGDLEDESIYRGKEVAEFEALVDSSLKNDSGCSTSGLYELVGLYLFLLCPSYCLLSSDSFIVPNSSFFNADFQHLSF